MRLLVVGGTRFLGRHLVAQALERGHHVTLLHRGRSGPGLFANAEHRIADRDGDLAVLDDGRWDAAIDTCAYRPRQVRALAARLAGRVGHYQLVSSISAYADAEARGLREDAPLATLADPATEVVDGSTYGGLKALCEAAAHEAFGDRCLLVRPGLLVGPYDPTERFTWWVRRFLRGGEILAPGDPAAPVQFIDARDAAAWMLRQAEAGVAGTFNLAGPAAPLTMGGLLETARRVLAPAATLRWVDEALLLAHGVAPWTDLPLWLPRASSGLHEVDLSRALACGLACRPLEQTLRDTAAWTDAPATGTAEGPPRPPTGLDAAREAALLDAARIAGGA